MVGVRSRAPRDVRKWLALDFKMFGVRISFGVRLAAVGSQPWEMSCHNKQVRSISTLLELPLALEGHLAFDADLALESHLALDFWLALELLLALDFWLALESCLALSLAGSLDCVWG